MMDFIRPRRPPSGIDLAPLIDCVFLLLIFFMLSSSFLQPALPLKLPSSTSTVMPDPRHLVISMDESGKIFINQEPVVSAALGERLLALSEGDTNRVVLFRGDRNIRYESFMEIVTTARAAGFSRISLQHESAAAKP